MVGGNPVGGRFEDGKGTRGGGGLDDGKEGSGGGNDDGRAGTGWICGGGGDGMNGSKGNF